MWVTLWSCHSPHTQSNDCLFFGPTIQCFWYFWYGWWQMHFRSTKVRFLVTKKITTLWIVFISLWRKTLKQIESYTVHHYITICFVPYIKLFFFTGLPISRYFFFNFYCYSITVVCLFSPSLHPTPGEPTSLNSTCFVVVLFSNDWN